jgi:PAS domain S-box-containing protein
MQEISDDALQTIMDALDARVAYLDADLRFRYVNAAFAASVGRSAEELVGSEYVELFPEMETRALLDRALATQETALLRTVAWPASSRPGTETTYWDWKITPLKRGDTFSGALLSITEVTELQLAQEARDRLIDILERTPDLISTATPEGRLLYANRAARETIGVPEPEIRGQPVVRAHPDWAAKLVVEEAVPTALQEGMWRGQTAILSHDGREVPVSQVVLAHRGPDGEVAYLSTILRDISEEQRLLEENRRQRWFLERLMEALPVGVAVVSGPEHRYEYANYHYRVMIHQSEQPVVGRTVHDVLPPRAVERATASLGGVYRTKRVMGRRAAEVPTTSGSERYWDIDHVPLLADDDTVESVLILVSEVTDAVRARKELDQERARLQAIIDDVPDGIIVFDREARVALVNRAGERIYRHPLLVGERYDRQPEIPLYGPDGVRYEPRSAQPSTGTYTTTSKWSSSMPMAGNSTFRSVRHRSGTAPAHSTVRLSPTGTLRRASSWSVPYRSTPRSWTAG